MGLFITKMMQLFQGESAKLLMLGLDAAGKTTVLYKVKLNENVTTIPTIGFNVETVEPVKGLSFTVWDIGGQDKIRALWQYYFQNTEGLVFVVDSSDRTRMAEAREELHAILEADEMRGVPVTVMANKQDLPTSMSPAELIDVLELRKLLGHKWHIQGTNALNGDGVYESMDAMARLVREFKSRNPSRF